MAADMDEIFGKRPGATRLTVQLPKGASGVRLLLSPTRSFVIGASWEERPATASEGDGFTCAGKGLEARWSKQLKEAQEASLLVSYRGEEPQLFAQDCRHGEPGENEDPEAGWEVSGFCAEGPMKLLYEHRRDSCLCHENVANDVGADRARRRSFFFELDHQTQEDYMAFNKALDRSEFEYRKKAMGCLAALMERRLYYRFQSNPTQLGEFSFQETLDHLGAPIEVVGAFSKIFWDATERLYQGSGREWSEQEKLEELGLALRLFGGGALREWMKPPESINGGKDVLTAEPDSFYIFFFAEFGIMAMESGVDEERWSSILPDLLMMQRVYVHRYQSSELACSLEGCQPTRDTVRAYDNWPKCVLDGAQVQEVVDLGSINMDRDQQIHDHLHLLAGDFGNPVGLDSDWPVRAGNP